MFLNDSKELYNTYTFNRIWKDRSICQIVNGIYNFRLRIRFLFEKTIVLRTSANTHLYLKLENYKCRKKVTHQDLCIKLCLKLYSLFKCSHLTTKTILFTYPGQEYRTHRYHIFFMKLKINDENIPINFNIILKINPKYYGYILI